VQPAGNHQVKHQPKIVLYSNGDALADSPQFAHHMALDTGNWRLCGSKQKGVSKSHSLERLCDDAWLEGTDIGDDIRQFRHAHQLACRNRISQPRLFTAGNHDGVIESSAATIRPTLITLW